MYVPPTSPIINKNDSKEREEIRCVNETRSKDQVLCATDFLAMTSLYNIYLLYDDE